MNTKRKFSWLAILIAISMLLSIFPMTAAAAPGDNLWVSETAWGQLLDPNGAPILPKGDQIVIPVTLTSAQCTILVTTPGVGVTDDEKSMPELDSSTDLYKNVVYIDTVNAPTTGRVYNYTFGFDTAMVTKGQKLYVKVGGTDVSATDNQKATTTYLGSIMPGLISNYSADNVVNDLHITTPSAVWTNPKVAITILGEPAPREISAGVAATDTLITVPNRALVSAFSDLSLSQITVTNIIIIDSAIEDIALNDQNITVSLATSDPSYGDISGDGEIDISDVIMAAEIAVGNDGYSTEQKARANVSDKNNPTIDISDVVLIAERAVGGVAPFPVELP